MTNSNHLQIKRGLKANLPTLEAGELALCTDTKEIYIGNGTGNILVGSTDKFNAIDELKIKDIINSLAMEITASSNKDDLSQGSFAEIDVQVKKLGAGNTDYNFHILIDFGNQMYIENASIEVSYKDVSINKCEILYHNLNVDTGYTRGYYFQTNKFAIIEIQGRHTDYNDKFTLKLTNHDSSHITKLQSLKAGAIDISPLATRIGFIEKLTTTNKDSLVSAINEVNSKAHPVTIEDVLTSTSATNALSANQGKALKDSLDGKLNKTGGTLTGDLTLGTNNSIHTKNINTLSNNVLWLNGSNEANYLAFSLSDTKIGITPSKGNISMFGGESARWHDMYGTNADFSGNVKIGTLVGDLTLGADNHVQAKKVIVDTVKPLTNNVMWITGNEGKYMAMSVTDTKVGITPSPANISTLGSSVARWNDIYATNVDISGDLTLGTNNSAHIKTIRPLSNNVLWMMASDSESRYIAFDLLSSGLGISPDASSSPDSVLGDTNAPWGTIYGIDANFKGDVNIKGGTIGDLAHLTTTNKTSLVNAINEIKGAVKQVLYVAHDVNVGDHDFVDDTGTGNHDGKIAYVTHGITPNPLISPYWLYGTIIPHEVSTAHALSKVGVLIERDDNDNTKVALRISGEDYSSLFSTISGFTCTLLLYVHTNE